MNGKITLPELSALLALASGRPRTACDNFLRAFINVISDALAQGESVKLKGFGTFGLTRVDARKSVDVATGREIEIAAHSRITFTPSKEMAAAVNAPFEMFEAVELADGFDTIEDTDEPTPGQPAFATDEYDYEIPDDDDAADAPTEVDTVTVAEIVEADMPEESEEPEEPAQTEEQSQTEEQAPVKAAPGQREIEESTDIFAVEPDDEPMDGKPEQEPDSESDTVAEDEAAEEASQPNQAAVAPAEHSSQSDTPELPAEPIGNEKADKGHHHRFVKGFIWGVVTGILTCVIAAAVTYAIVYYQLTRISDYYTTPKAEKVEPAPAETTLPPATPDTIVAETDTASKVDAQKADATVDTAPSDRPAKVKWDTIGKTRYLTTMAKEHYGNYHLWPYIYEENKSILGHPDRIKPGTRIRIPDIKKYGVDPNNPEHIKRAKRLGVEIYARYK